MGIVNKTLQELNASDKPSLTIFNKMDLYEQKTFDKWLEESTKKEILNDLEERWQRETFGDAIFISATEKRNVAELRKKILDKVRALYKIRYPYREVHF